MTGALQVALTTLSIPKEAFIPNLRSCAMSLSQRAHCLPRHGWLAEVLVPHQGHASLASLPCFPSFPRSDSVEGRLSDDPSNLQLRLLRGALHVVEFFVTRGPQVALRGCPPRVVISLGRHSGGACHGTPLRRKAASLSHMVHLHRLCHTHWFCRRNSGENHQAGLQHIRSKPEFASPSCLQLPTSWYCFHCCCFGFFRVEPSSPPCWCPSLAAALAFGLGLSGLLPLGATVGRRKNIAVWSWAMSSKMLSRGRVPSGFGLMLSRVGAHAWRSVRRSCVTPGCLKPGGAGSRMTWNMYVTHFWKTS